MDLIDLVQGRVSILYEGPWTEDMVRISVNKTHSPYISRELKQIAAERYNLRQKERAIRGLRALSDNDVMHLCREHSCITKKEAYLAMGPIKYSQYCIATPEVANMLECTVLDLPIGMAVNVVIVTPDKKVVMMKASGHVDFPERIDVPGGVYSGDTPFMAIYKEISEEVGLHREELLNIRLLGMSTRFEDRTILVLTFFADTLLNSEEVLERAKHAPDSWEGQILFLVCESDALRHYLLENGKDSKRKMVSSCFSALVLAGRHMWGQEWSKIK